MLKSFKVFWFYETDDKKFKETKKYFNNIIDNFNNCELDQNYIGFMNFFVKLLHFYDGWKNNSWIIEETFLIYDGEKFNITDQDNVICSLDEIEVKTEEEAKKALEEYIKAFKERYSSQKAS